MDGLPCLVALVRSESHEIITSNKRAAKVGAVAGQKCYYGLFGRESPCPWCQAPKAFAEVEQQEQIVECNEAIWDCHWVPIKKELCLHYIFDITERKRTERALKESREHLRAVLDASQEIIFAKDLEGRYTQANAAFSRLFEIPREQIIGKKDDEIFPKEEAEKLRAIDLRIFDTAVASCSEDILTVKGRRHIFRTTKVPLLDANGRVKGLCGFAEDITERKKAQNELKKARDLAQKYLDIAGVIILALDREGVVTLINKKGCELLGYRKEEIIGRDWFENFLPGQIREEAREVFSKLISGELEEPYNYYENPILTKEGEQRLIAWYNVPVYDEAGEIVGTLSSGQDITEQRRAEAEKESLSKFPAQSPYPILRLARDGTVLYANPAGYPLLEQWGRQVCRDLAAKVLESGIKKQIEAEHNGRFFLLSVVPIPGSDYVNIYGFDITEQKKAQRQIESLAKFPDEDPNPVLRIAGNGTVLYSNRAGLPLLKSWGCEVGSRLSGYWQLLASASLNEGRNRETETECGGRIFTLTFAPVVDSNYVNVYGHDVTDRKQAELQLVKQQAQLKSLASQLTLAEERERRRIAGELHDNVSQALAFSKMKLDMLCKSIPDTAVLGVLREISDTLSQMLQNTKALTFDLSSPVLYELGFEAAVAEWLSEQIERKHGIDTEFEDDKSHKPLDDDIRVLLFRNTRELLINVVKHARASKVKVSVRRIDRQIEVCIEDDGIGFDPCKIAKLAGRRGEFGLFSIRQRLEEVGGKLWIDSAPGRGCKVTMTAPLKGVESTTGR